MRTEKCFFVNLKKNEGGVGSGGRVGGQGGCERRSEFFVKIQKTSRGGVGLVGGSGRGIGGGQGVCERNVGGRGDVGYGDVNQE